MDTAEDTLKDKGLKKRGDVYWARIIIPLDIKPRFGKTKIEKSLTTRDRREATQRNAKFRAEWLAHFEAVRNGSASPQAVPESLGAPYPRIDLSDLYRAALERIAAQLSTWTTEGIGLTSSQRESLEAWAHSEDADGVSMLGPNSDLVSEAVADLLRPQGATLKDCAPTLHEAIRETAKKVHVWKTALRAECGLTPLDDFTVRNSFKRSMEAGRATARPRMRPSDR